MQAIAALALLSESNDVVIKEGIIKPGLCSGVLWYDEINSENQWAIEWEENCSLSRRTVRSILNCRCGSIHEDDFISGILIFDPETQFLFEDGFLKNGAREALRWDEFLFCPWCALQIPFIIDLIKLMNQKEYLGSKILDDDFPNKLSEGFFELERFKISMRNWIWDQQQKKQRAEFEASKKQAMTREPSSSVFVPSRKRR